MRRPSSDLLAALGLVVLLVLHVDAWRPQRSALLLGWLPEELAYRLAWILLAWVYLLFVCARVWRERDP